MNEENIQLGPDGEPIIRLEPKASRWAALAGLSDVPGMPDPLISPPPFSVPLSANHGPTVEVVPGIMVSEHLIRSAVEATTEPGAEDEIERRMHAATKAREELRQDIEKSREVVQAMMDRVRNPPNMKEKYISFDALPAPLQRVMTAYTAAAEANKELEDALAALKQSAGPPTTA